MQTFNYTDWQKDNMRPGKYLGIPEDEYHKHPAMSQSLLKSLLNTYADYEHEKANPKKSDAMDFGTAYHTFVLSPQEFDKKYIICPFNHAGKKDYKDWVQGNFDGREILKQQDFEQINDMYTALTTLCPPFDDNCNNPIKALMQDVNCEVTYLYEEPETGILCRCRIDVEKKNLEAIIDFKTTQKGKAKPASFRRVVEEYGYHIQAAFYIDAFKVINEVDIPDERVFFVVQEKEPPYLSSIQLLHPDYIAIGRHIYQAGLDRYKQYQMYPGMHKGYPPIQEQLEPTNYYQTNYMEIHNL